MWACLCRLPEYAQPTCKISKSYMLGACVLSLVQRILKVDYHIPSHIKLSPEGHDLLRKVLVADPGSRINIQQVCDGFGCWQAQCVAAGQHQHGLCQAAVCAAPVVERGFFTPLD